MTDRSERAMFAAVWVLIAFALFYFGAHVAIAVHRGTFPPEPRPAAPVACQEDEPCWNCTTMGNRVCGPGVTR